MTPEPTKATRGISMGAISIAGMLQRDHLAGVADHPREALPAEESVDGGLHLGRIEPEHTGRGAARIETDETLLPAGGEHLGEGGHGERLQPFRRHRRLRIELI